MIEHLREIWANLAVSCIFAAVCGSLSYLLKVEEGKQFKWTEFILHTVISAVCGLITYTTLRNLAGFDPDVCGSLLRYRRMDGNAVTSCNRSKNPEEH